MATVWSRKWWPEWLPFIGYRRELIRRDDAEELGLATVRGMNWAQYDTFCVSWFGAGVAMWVKGPLKLPGDLPWDYDGDIK